MNASRTRHTHLPVLCLDPVIPSAFSGRFSLNECLDNIVTEEPGGHHRCGVARGRVELRDCPHFNVGFYCHLSVCVCQNLRTTTEEAELGPLFRPSLYVNRLLLVVRVIFGIVGSEQ